MLIFGRVGYKCLLQFQFCKKKKNFTFFWHLICRNEAFQLVISYKIELIITPSYGLAGRNHSF
jgi:hypothetical protein